MAASAVYLIPTVFAPIAILWSDSNKQEEALVLSAYSGGLLLAYVLIGHFVLKRFTHLFPSVTDEALRADELADFHVAVANA